MLKNLTRLWRENYIFLREFKYFPKVTALALIFSLLASVSDGIGIGVILSFLQSLINPDVPTIQTGIHWVDVWFLGINDSPQNRLYRLSCLIFLIIWARSGFLYLQRLYIEMTQINLIDCLRKRLFDQFQSLSLSYFSTTRSGELINSITTEINQLQNAFASVGNLIVTGMIIWVYGLALFIISWQLSIAAGLSLTFLSIAISTFRKKIREASFKITKSNGHFTSVAIEFLSGIFTVQAFATQDFERQRFYQASSEIARNRTKLVWTSALVQPLSAASGTTIIIILLIVGFIGLNIPVAVLLTFIYALLRLLPNVQGINLLIAQISRFQGSLNNLKELLRTDNKPYFKNGTVIFTGFKHKLDLVSVKFSYNDDLLVIRGINLEIKKGQMTALVGASGAGKSTLADLIPRFYDPQQGKILIDGVDLRELEINSLRRKMAVVSQDTFIFNASVKYNIAYGTEDADDEAIEEAAKLAHAMDFIQELPEGFYTLLGDRGVRLSGGQRQRIAIARAILRNPEILILDEATSALDSESERLIQSALEKLSENRTVIAIAHRLSTIAKANQVVVLEQGKIVEQGSYQELINQKGKLWHYHQLQYELT